MVPGSGRAGGTFADNPPSWKTLSKLREDFFRTVGRAVVDNYNLKLL